jgi:hypothetical protein
MRKALMLLIFVLLLTGCGNTPPMPTLTVNQKNIDFELGSYTWRSLVKTTIADAASPTILVKDLTPHDVSPKSHLSIKFSKKPEKIFLSQWEDNKELNQIELQDNSFQLPTEKGTYIYSIRSQWNNGSGTYAFVIRVE